MADDKKRRTTACSRPVVRDGYSSRCRSSDYDYCPGCATIYMRHTRMLIGAGIVEKHNYFLLTLTAPSFGKVHKAPHSPSDKIKRCDCGDYHKFEDGYAGVPLNSKTYGYKRAVEWNKNSSKLFAKTMELLSRRFGDFEYAAVREYQRRGSVHYHAIARVRADVPVKAVLSLLASARATKTPDASWGGYDVQLVQGDAGELTLSSLSRIVSYSTKALDKKLANSLLQDAHYLKLSKSAKRLGLSDKRVRGFGYGGQIFSKSNGWCSMTRESLYADMCSYAAANASDDAVRAVVVDENADNLVAVAESLGNGFDYAPVLSMADVVRARLLA